ncbi:MAG: NAD(P)-dependent oxidoreductase [Thermaerobacterales bacterium]
MKTVAVTGATGFLGANLTLQLAERGYEVIACDLREAPQPLADAAEAAQGTVRWWRFDVTDDSAWDLLGREAVDALIHGGAVTPADESRPLNTVAVNLGGTVRSLEYARRNEIKRVIVMSSSSVYRDAGGQPGEPLPEELPVTPLHGYGICKIAGEAYAAMYRRDFAVDALSVRMTSIYGPWERSTGSRTRMSPIYRMALAAVTGAPLRIEDRLGTTDWMDVAEAARGLIHLLELDRIPYDVVNLSTGRLVGIDRVVTALSSLCPDARLDVVSAGEDAVVDFVAHPNRGGRPLAVDRLRSTGFQTEETIEDSLARYVEWLSHEDHLRHVMPAG